MLLPPLPRTLPRALPRLLSCVLGLQVLEELSRGITNKLLHGPMQALRSDGTDAQSVSETLVSMHALERMFDLQNEIPIAREASSALDD